ncbi:hypothetical protein JCM33374_g4720 [Metschnikowia sp. JCM 33374]|nr:hypothetical protein JCM33374_g4720 [Metschnikowia sp. JCM 33374]
MQHQNISTHSLNENLYDISFASTGDHHRVGPKKKPVPRRVGSISSLNSLPESKRPSEYYLARLSQNSATSQTSASKLTLTLSNTSTSTTASSPMVVGSAAGSAAGGLAANSSAASAPAAHSSAARPRPASDSSAFSAEASKDSDDASSVVSTPFDVMDSRLSSMTNYSSYSNTKPGDSTVSPSAATEMSSHSAVDVDSVTVKSINSQTNTVSDSQSQNKDASLDQLNRSLSTITLKNPPPYSTESVLELPPAPPVPPKLRASSTTSVLELKKQATYQNSLPTLSRQASTTSSFMLSRSKTRYYNPKETKERKQLRKKLYEENDDDDELLTNDMDLVFNVPVIKNHGEIYRTRRTESVPSVLLSRKDIVTGDDNKYPHKHSESMRPCPLPGNLSRSNLSMERVPSAKHESRFVARNASINENEIPRNSSFAGSENDTEICNNISDFYTQRSASYSMLARASRDQQLTDRMPSFVKSQSSVEDLSLISPEKLELVDQSRPINLPPKNTTDRTKHHKELHRVITDFEVSTQNAKKMRRDLGLSAVANQQSWFKLMSMSDDKDFDRKLNYDREKYRKLNWETLISSKFRFDYYMKVLLLSSGKDFSESVEKSLAQLEKKVTGLSQQMKATKDSEFSHMIEQVMQRPLFRNFLVQMAETENAHFDSRLFREQFRRLLYLKSFSDGGLQKHHQIFVIPSFLIMFQNTESFSNICILIELFDREIFNADVFSSLNKKLSCWSDLSKMSSSSAVYKVLKRFSSLQEFEHLSSTSLFEIIIQLNDRLPLSLSAPSTPIVAEGAFRSAKSSSDSEGGAKGSSDSSTDGVSEYDFDSVFSASSSLSLIGVFLQLLVIHSRSKNKKQKFVNLLQGFLLTIFQYYHLNWNSCGELVRGNKSIKLNNSNDQLMNLESFLDKWKEIFKKL